MRLVLAWKSQLQCTEYADLADTLGKAHHLLQLASNFDKKFSVMQRKKLKQSTNCVSFQDYVTVLEAIGKANQRYQINPHFIKQDCLEDYVEYDDSFATEALDSNTFNKLKRFANFSEVAHLERFRKNQADELNITSTQLQTLTWFNGL